MSQDNQLTIVNQESVFSGAANFEHGQRVAKMLSASTLIPKEFQGNVQNVMIALEMSNRIGASPLMVMQNLYIVHGKPSWSSTFIIAAINSCGKFAQLRFEMSGANDERSCTAWSHDLLTGERLEGPAVSISMAKKEGWFSKSGSKWQTMPELMLRYRAATFFGRLYAPEVMMGMHTQDELTDMGQSSKPTPFTVADKEAERLTLLLNDCKTVEDVRLLQEQLPNADIAVFEARKETLKNA